MGLRTASLRPQVMAPALTSPKQQQAFGNPKFLHECGSGESEQAPVRTPPGDIMSGSPTLSDRSMGLHKGSLEKINRNDVEQMLNLEGDPPGEVDLPQNVDELMQVIKSIPDEEIVEKFLTDVDMMNMSMEEQPDLKENQTRETLTDLKTIQNRIERRLDFLRRKVRKIQARSMGKHASGEVAGVYEYVHRSLKRLKDSTVAAQLEEDTVSGRSSIRPMSYGSTKTIMKKLEIAANLQANYIARQKNASSKYFGSGSSDAGNHRISVSGGVVNVPPWPVEHKDDLKRVAGSLKTELCVVQRDVDSEATESSSGGESCDEMQTYNNPHQQYLSIQKRALWKYASQRAAVASRWTWLQAQIADLEYRIRQHSDIQRQLRASKGEIQLGGPGPPPAPTSPTAVNGYRGQLPGSSPLSSMKATDGTTANGAHVDYQCARTRPLVHFKKRKLLQLNGLHMISKKAARPSTVRCGCVKADLAPCALCTGRTDPMHPRDPTDALSKAERVALVDGGYHPVFSMPEDVSYAIHCEAIMKNQEWQQRSTRMKSLKILKGDRSDKNALEHRSKKVDHRKKYSRLLKSSTMSALSAIKKKEKSTSTAMAQLQSLVGDGTAPGSSIIEDEEVESIGNNSNNVVGMSNSATASPSSSPLLHMQAISGYSRKNRTNSYDIDNIVIPYSVAAATRVEKLQYKEILTPKWRIADIDLKCDKYNGAVTNPSQDSDVDIYTTEDLSGEAVITRHDKSEYEERKKFLSYLKLPWGHYHHHGSRQRSHKRTDSLAESSGANTPDPMSPHPIESTSSPINSPPDTPLSVTEKVEDLPSIGMALRRRTTSQGNGSMAVVGEVVEVTPFECRTFPLDDVTYEDMLKGMPENHQFQTNYRAQDSCDYPTYLDDKLDSPGTESTESAIGDEDPNDPEWVDMERVRDRHKR